MNQPIRSQTTLILCLHIQTITLIILMSCMQNIMYIEQARAVGDKTITSHNQLYVCMCMYLLWTLRCICTFVHCRGYSYHKAYCAHISIFLLIIRINLDLTFLSCSCYLNNLSDIGRHFSKERDLHSRSHPSTDVPYQFRILTAG